MTSSASSLTSRFAWSRHAHKGEFTLQETLACQARYMEFRNASEKPSDFDSRVLILFRLGPLLTPTPHEWCALARKAAHSSFPVSGN